LRHSRGDCLHVFDKLLWEAMITRPSILEAFRLDKKIARVTGASAGIGASIAQAISEAGGLRAEEVHVEI